MKVHIYPVMLGVDQYDLLRGESIIMIDGGAPRQGKKFLKAVERLSIKPDNIALIVLTHGRWDQQGRLKISQWRRSLGISMKRTYWKNRCNRCPRE